MTKRIHVVGSGGGGGRGLWLILRLSMVDCSKDPSNGFVLHIFLFFFWFHIIHICAQNSQKFQELHPIDDIVIINKLT